MRNWRIAVSLAGLAVFIISANAQTTVSDLDDDGTTDLDTTVSDLDDDGTTTNISPNASVATISPIIKEPRKNCSDNQDLVDFKCIDHELKSSNSSLFQFLVVAVLSVSWVIYVTFFNSRLIGLILTKILNQFVKDGFLKIGSFSFSVLSGKIMFRDVQYITPDSSIFIYDGYCIFRWWRPHKFSPWRKKRDLNEGHTRLSVVLSGLEYHVYNRSDVYGRLEELFGIDSQIFTTKSKVAKQSPKKSDAKDSQSQKISWWRNLIPVIKLSIPYGKVIFGNCLLPSTLVVAYEDANAQYKTAKASNKFDLFMHILEGKLGSVRFMLVPSLKYDPAVLPEDLQAAANDPPPRTMSEGYDLINSNNVSFKYVWDEPGKTGMPLAQSKFSEYQAKTGDTNLDDDNTLWELELRCERRVMLNYGPWADRQINLLWRYYYPSDYQKQQITPQSKHGEIRAATSFNMYVNLLHESDIDLLFLKNDEPSAIHIQLMKGSCIELHVPMTVAEDGFTTQVSGQLIYPDASTSMSYRPLISAETISFNITANYPLIWNAQQTWICDIKASKVSASLVFQHKNFIADLMDDWSNRDPPDLLTFAPYKMQFNFDLQDFELLLPANEYNWVDCATKRKENALVALTGRSLKIDFTLPFHSFLATIFTIPFSFHVVRGELCLFLPQSNPTRNMLLNLSNGMDAWNTGEMEDKVLIVGDGEKGDNLPQSSAEVQDPLNANKYPYEHRHRLCKDPTWGSINSDWVKCWDVPELEIAISYMWHPIVQTPNEIHHKRSRDSDLNKEIEKVDKILQKMNRTSKKASFKKASMTDSTTDIADSTPLLQETGKGTSTQAKTKPPASVMFDPTSLDPDEIRVDLTLKPGSTLFLYGSLLHHFIAVKENYLGVDDTCTDLYDGQNTSEPEVPEQNSNPLYYRTLQVTVNVNLHEITGVLPVHANPTFKRCPTVRLKRLTFEMDKNYHQTRLQLLLSKLAISLEEKCPAASIDVFEDGEIGRKGWLMLTDLQVRGHAMFSGAGLHMGSATVEYGWLTEVLVGPIIGCLSVPQIQLLAQWVQTFVFLLKNSLHEMKPAYPNKYLPTGVNWEDKKMDGKPIAEGDVKYLMTQGKLESVKLRVQEEGSVLDLVVSPVLVSNGNMQFPGVKEAASIRIQEVWVKHRIRKTGNHCDADTGPENITWVEAGEVRFGSLHAMITVATPEREMSERQTKFLRLHDKMTRRLHFLWQDALRDEPDSTENSALLSVRSLKSWGCYFLTPLTSKHPTYFYKLRKTPPPKQRSMHDGRRIPVEDESAESSTSSIEEDSSERDSDVFDPGMDYGMSLLDEGRCLLSRSRTLSRLTQKSSSSVNSAPCEGEDESIKDEEDNKKTAGEILASDIENVTETKPRERRSSRPSLKRQIKINNSTGNIVLPFVNQRSSSITSASLQKVSAFRKPRSATVVTPSERFTQPTHQQVSFAPSPEKLSALKRSSSQADVNAVTGVESPRPAVRRALSSDSNLYRSAESDFKSTTSLSSSMGEDFYSAESDLNESRSTAGEKSSVEVLMEPVPEIEEKEVVTRPGTLVLESDHPPTGSTISTSVSNGPQTTPALSPMKSTSLSPTSVNSGEGSSAAELRRSKLLLPPSTQTRQRETLLACYESHLTLLHLKPVEMKAKKCVEATDEEDNDWFDEDSYILPGFAIIRDGIHPSVMVDRESTEQDDHHHARHRLHHRQKMETNRELSFADIDSSGKSTSVSVHLREPLDIQLTPFLLSTISNIMDAAAPLIKHENPLSVISQLEMDCLNDSVELLPEDAENKKNTEKQEKSKSGDKPEKARPSLKRQKRMEATLDSEIKTKVSSTHTVTRPSPGTKLSVKIDKVRVNVVQTTLGDDKIFSLRSNKLLPTPCVIILATRLDSLRVSVDMNSRRKNRLLMENLRKLSRSNSATSEKKVSSQDASNYKKYSTSSSELVAHKHFLVLLNAKATARSASLQMRAMTCDGSLPELTSISALSDKDCKAPFLFDPTAASPTSKETIEKWSRTSTETPEPSLSGRRKISRYRASGPPKIWGWVLFEAGIDRVRLNVIKQVPVKGTRDIALMTSDESALRLRSEESRELANLEATNGTASDEGSVHIHFVDEKLASTSNIFTVEETDGEWAIQDTSLHASQGELFVGSVWINLPSPTASSLTSARALRSWNLLSCVSAGISCWLDPGDCLVTSLAELTKEILIRQCAVTACILTEAFDQLMQGKDGPEKVMEPLQMKYDVFTTRTKLLRKDPNFLLCHEMQRFLSTPEGRRTVFAAVGPSGATQKLMPDLPALSTLKKGVSALIRQWTSQYSGVISSAKAKNASKGTLNKNNGAALGFETIDGKDTTGLLKTVTPEQSSLVLEVEAPKFTGESEITETTMVHTDAVPRRQAKPFGKSDTFMSLSAIEEIASFGSAQDAEKGQAVVDGASRGVTDGAGKQPRTPSKPPHMSPTELYEQQKSMYGWMTNQTKASSPTKGLQPGYSQNDDIEPRNLIQNEVFGIEETHFISSALPTTGGPQENTLNTSRKPETPMEITNSEEVFQIFLHNVGIDINAPAPVKTRKNVSFIRGECLGSLAVTAKLKLLRVDKQEADPLYNLDGQGKRKRKSSKIRKPRAYYSSLEHARELREPYVLNTSTWPHVYSSSAFAKPPPILLCQEVEVKSSIIETDVETKDSKNDLNFTDGESNVEKAVQSLFAKKRTTLKVGAELSIDNIVQHVDIALIRLLYQITQISDIVRQAKTDIQVNKYTEGSASPDFKVLHKRTISSVSYDSGNVNGLPLPKRHNFLTCQTGVESGTDGEEHFEETDAASNDSASTASTEVPHCWQVMYKMVDLYESVPENKTEMVKKIQDTVHIEHEGSVGRSERSGTFSLPPLDPYLSLVLKVTAGVKKIEMHAAVGDLKLNAQILHILTKVDHSKEVLNAYKNKASSKFNTTLQSVNIKLVDHAGKPQTKMIANASIKHSSLDACTNHERESTDNIAELHLGLVSFDLSQHPASLHDVVSRGSKQLSVHISEFAQTPTMKQHPFDLTDGGTPCVPGTPAPSSTTLPPMTPVTPSALTTIIDLSQDSSSAVTAAPVNARYVLVSDGIAVVASLLPSLHAEYKTGSLTGEGQTGLDATFSVCLQKHMLQFTTMHTGYDLNLERQATTVIDLPKINIDGEYKQGVSDRGKPFTDKWRNDGFGRTSEAANGELQLRSGDYLSIGIQIGNFEHSLTTDLLNQLVYLQEVFLKEINEMIEKVSKTNKPTPFWSETSLRSEESSVNSKPLLYQLKLNLKGIQITAVTPSGNAVRLKTGEMMFELSNRVIQDKGRKKKKRKTKGLNVPKYLKLFGKAQVDLVLSLGTLVRNSVYPEAEDDFMQLAYFTTRIGLQNTRQGKDDQAGQARGCASATAFCSTATTTEGGSVFNNTSTHSVDDRLLNPQANASGEDCDNSVVLISLTRPLFFIQPTAFDKAILVYLSYKNAYEDWREQQKNVLKAARQVRDVIQSTRSRPTSSTSLPRATQQRTSTVFLQLSVNDLGICLPVAETVQLHEVTKKDELPSALVLTIDNTLISAYYSRSLVTKGQMKGFCLRFVDDFQTSWDDWKQNPTGVGGDTTMISPSTVMNACIVPEGTYEICSNTTTHHSQSGGPPVAKTTLNILWTMKGMDVHFDTKIGSYFSRLTDTLMAITGNDEQTYAEELDIQSSQSDDEILEKTRGDTLDGGALPPGRRSRSATVPSTASSQAAPLEVQKERTRKIEHELNEQVKVLNDLRQLGAKKSVVEEEERRMRGLESALSSNFRRVFKSRLKRSSMKTQNQKESSVKKFKPTHQRTQSAATESSTSNIPATVSKSEFATLPPYKTTQVVENPTLEAFSSIGVGYRPSNASDFSSPRHPSPLIYELDHVFPPSPDRNYGRLARQSDDSEEEESSFEEDEIDGRELADISTQPINRLVYPDQAMNEQAFKLENNSVNISQTTNPAPEAELQLELTVTAVVNEGRIECHPYLQEIDVSARPDYGMMPSTYAASKIKTFVKNTTVFYIPGLDVKVRYNSATSGSAPNTSEAKRTKEKVFLFSPQGMGPIIEQSETSIMDSPVYLTPPPTVSGIISEDQPHASLGVDAGVPDIEITTPSRFAANKPENIFAMPEPLVKTSLPSAQSRRACIHALLSLQSLPEMVVTPYLLDFLEQTLNEVAILNAPAQSSSQKHSASSSRHGSFHESFAYSDEDGSDLDQGEHNGKPMADGSVLSSESPLVSLPLDVVVAVNVQPSQVRFNCVPMSRVECLLQIPSIDLEFSSFQDDSDGLEFRDADREDGAEKKSESDGEPKLDQSTEFATTANQSKKGLSFSAGLSDFSVYVFHPYGGKQPAAGSFPLDMTGSFMGSPTATGTTDSPSTKSGSGRRDSLSVNLEFVKITMIRKTKGDTVMVADFLSPGSTRGRLDNVFVDVNGLLDIGKASFKYDMRRLNEILAFPRAWYRRSIARRLFLGDTSEQPATSATSPHLHRKGSKQARATNVKNSTSHSRPHAHSAAADSSILSLLTVDSPLSPQQRRPSKSKTSNSGRRLPGINEPEDELDGSSGCPHSPTKWQALVMLKMNMSRLDVEMNMSNVMGNTVWSCDALSSTGKLMFHSNGDRDITLACSLDNSQLYARGGIIGGNIELQKFDADCHLFDPVDDDPLHKLGMRAESLDGRIEYMGGCVMMGQLTKVDFQLKDEWRDPVQSIPSSMDKGTVYVHCDLGWRVFQLAISRSTTPDVIKMLSKLEEFFFQQLHSSVRVISSLTRSHTRPTSPKRMKERIVKDSSLDSAAQYNHRRHWPPVFKAVSTAIAESEYFSSQRRVQNGSLLLGGSACLHGEALIVVCFHGTNFRSRSWVLFNILQPNIVHSSEVQEIKETVSGDETSTLAIQSLTVNLGHDIWLSRTQKPADPMATVSRVTRSRNQNPPPGSAAISEWFAYMTASHNEELKMLRTLNDLGAANAGQSTATSTMPSPQLGRHTDSASSVAYSHEADIIFALPKVQLDFKTEHIQGPTEPDPNDPDGKPVVECSFVTEFTDHICVTMDVELLLFLHDLISSYLKEKQQALSTRTKLSSLNVGIWNENFDGSYTAESSTPKLMHIDPIDLREFVCKTWQLEPTVRLISWAGRRIEPVGVDYILQKLGFQQARTTIPKWIQRGVLDLLDKGLAVTVEKLVVAIIKGQKNT